jgi:hypothetical protein
MIKKWKEFNESNSVVDIPTPGEECCKSYTLKGNDSELFNQEPSLEKLIADKKVRLIGNEIWLFDDDEETDDILKQYLDI